jgi:hypothetical protein
MILYVLNLKGVEEILEIMGVTDEKGIVKYAKNIDSYGNLENTLFNMKYYLSQTGTFYEDQFCIMDMEFITINEFKIANYFFRNYAIYKNLMGLVRDEKLKELGI